MHAPSNQKDLPHESLSTLSLFVEVEGVRDVEAGHEMQLLNGELLEKALTPYLERVEIVISDWRAFHAPRDAFRQQLPATPAQRVVDSMFLPELTSSSWSEYPTEGQPPCLA